MKKTIFFLIFFSLAAFPTSLFGQQEHSSFWQHLRYGGGLGVSFGDGFFSGTLAPSALYEFSEIVGLGVGLSGTYNSLKDRYHSTILGGSLITLANVIPEIQLSVEFETLNVSRNFEDFLGIEDDHYWYPALFLGAGYRSQNITFGIRYDVLYDASKSIYADPWMPFVRLYF